MSTVILDTPESTPEQTLRLRELAVEEARIQLERERIEASAHFRSNLLRFATFVFFMSLTVLVGYLSTHK